MPEATDVTVQLAVINTKLDALLVQRDDHEVRLRHVEESVSVVRDVPGKVAALEKFRWQVGAIAGVASAVGAYVLPLVFNK